MSSHLATLGITIHPVEVHDTLSIKKKAVINPADIVTALLILPDA